jgi:hypothetical protein
MAIVLICDHNTKTPYGLLDSLDKARSRFPWVWMSQFMFFVLVDVWTTEMTSFDMEEACRFLVSPVFRRRFVFGLLSFR